MWFRFSHVTLIATDWRKLSQFYVDALGCEITYPEINLAGPWLDSATGIKNTRIRGVNLKLPGLDTAKNGGPYMEILQYTPAKKLQTESINTPGSGQIAFEVEDVKIAAQTLASLGALPLGKFENIFMPGVGNVRFQYFHDPEKNLIQLMRWDRI
ncbi:Glyoxalase-like domain protein [Poriferisphaera corsica]|uniref:Glyoxalase-like domain protein n=1 Tax=Poriferisphaera corsica TaxID=2528020 RepID=A0A517YQ96_9BACT|nr:VOC family protein [Poriferisphaera corsica]QDU32388.1 Glyoxalase-like domain protein [Poriferisphaera corsica]